MRERHPHVRLIKRSSLLLAVVLSMAFMTAPAAVAQTPQGDHVAVEVNTHDNTNVFDLSFNIRRVMAQAVDIDNAAAAVSSCDSCRTIAVAIQIVLIFSDPDVVTTDNLALALNVECSSCETMALAYQYVLTTGGPVHFTADGNKAIREILRQITEIGSDEELSLQEIYAAIDPLVDQLYAIVDTELVPAGRPATKEETEEAVETASPAPTPMDVATPSETTAQPTDEPSDGASPSPSGTPVTAGPSPTEEPSPAVTP